MVDAEGFLIPLWVQAIYTRERRAIGRCGIPGKGKLGESFMRSQVNALIAGLVCSYLLVLSLASIIHDPVVTV